LFSYRYSFVGLFSLCLRVVGEVCLFCIYVVQNWCVMVCWAGFNLFFAKKAKARKSLRAALLGAWS